MRKFDQDVCNEIVRFGLLSEEVINKAIELSKNEKVPFLLYLQSNNLVPEENLLKIESELSSIPFVSLQETIIEESAIRAVPVRVAWHYEFIPVSLEGNKLVIAVNSPLSVRSQDEIRLSLGYEISMLLAKRDQILSLLKMHYGLAADTVYKMVGGPSDGKYSESTPYEGIEDIEKMADDASIIRLVNQIILEAFKKRSTDIHIEPFRGKLSVRYRIDGKLHEQPVPEDFSKFLSPILSRIKIMANLNIVEHRLPQDGRAIVRIQDQVLDLRVSFMPTPHGESVVIRILPSRRQFDLEKLGLTAADMKQFEMLMKRTNGIIFVTGPTGSGKTTTLYACLEKLNTIDKKIITIEDPVEYEMEGVVQIQINPEVGLTFAKGLKSMLRQDPNIMMVGEVRDRETADIAIRVALTGHLVFSTLHTNDAATGVTRLMDIGIQPYLIASSVQTFIAQRLIRVICNDCKTENLKIDPKIKELIAKNLGISQNDVKIYRGKGCEKCNFSGFYGRTAVYEILNVDNEIRKMILDRAAASEIKKKAVSKGMKTLMKDGWRKVAEGVTTPEEVLRACQDSDLMLDLQESGKDFILKPVKDIPAVGQEDKDVKKTEIQPELSKGEDGADIPEAQQDTDPSNKRVYTRFIEALAICYSLVKKSEGDILKLHKFSDGIVRKTVGEESVNSAETGDIVSEYEVKDIPAKTNNVSAGGLVMNTEYVLPVGSMIDLSIKIPGESRDVTCLAKVVRIERYLPHMTRIAVCYLDMAKSDRQIIEKFCASAKK
ncbi:MAG TPA: ATPase, T2SS/T4P/T4SS family [Candidatus Omnitrophota bacterium]|nr:ATPase, T2SS/T4P/T4SS family [Candidatus Omnitrophota bacterium]HPS19603.1 ATPase, T2SS/T4P/T4SS family [Candidatus Omnitrophota bacterium]